MKLHGLILADISRKSNLAIQAYQDGIALLPAACGVGRGGRRGATRSGVPAAANPGAGPIGCHQFTDPGAVA